MNRLIIILIFLLSVISSAQISIAEKFEYRTQTYKGTSIPYRLFVPENYNPTQKYPLVLALHGSGERGSDNTRHVNNYRLATVWADSINQLKYPAFVVAPQAPSDGTWFTSFPVDRYPIAVEMEVVLNILDSLENEFNIDENRLYITGLSLGGYGTWDVIARYPDKFAAAIPMSGGGDVQSVASLLHMPIWNFHGRLDNAVHISQSTELLNEFESYGRNVLYTHCSPANCDGLADSTILRELSAGADLIHTEYQNGGHVIWDESYDYKYLLDWVYRQNKINTPVLINELLPGQILNGEYQIKWNAVFSEGFVDFYYSDDAGIKWKLLAENIPNTGTYNWNTNSVDDCAFGQLKVILKDKDYITRGYDNSDYFSINNAKDGKPFVRILNGHFTASTRISDKQFDIEMLIGDPDEEEAVVLVQYTPDGQNFILIDSLALDGNPNKLKLPLHLESYQNSKNAFFTVTVLNATGSYSDQTYTFIKDTPRESANPDKLEFISKLFDVPFTLNITDRSQLKNHEYLLTFDDTTSSSLKYFDVYDITDSHPVFLKQSFIPNTESPIFDGLSFTAEDIFTKHDLNRSGWNSGVSKRLNFTMNRFVLSANASYNGYPQPNDYKIIFYDTIVDSSTADTLYPVTPSNTFIARPVNFSIFNTTTGQPVDFAYTTSGSITKTHSIWLLEKLNQKKKRTWRISIIDNDINRTIPFGDTLYLYTYKGLSIYDSIKVLSNIVNVKKGLNPVNFYLNQNYPNPFNPKTVINFGIPESGRVKIEIYNPLGERVYYLLDKEMNQGVFNLSFDGSDLASGIYLYKLETKDQILVKKDAAAQVDV